MKTMKANQPNVLFIVADDHRHHAINALGETRVQTPALNELISRGACFTQNRHQGGLCAAVCIPTRAALLTGVDTFHNTTTTQMDDVSRLMTLREELVTLPQAFGAAGYDTFFTGKWHNDRAAVNRSFKSGSTMHLGEACAGHFDTPVYEYDPTGTYASDAAVVEESHSTELFCGAAIHYLQNRRTNDHPFFLYLALRSPHDPRITHPEWHARYNPDDIDLPLNFMPAHPFDQGDYRIRDEKLAAFPRTPEEIKRHIADYYAMISHHDHHLGRVFDTLREQEQLANTLIVYTADHGLGVGQHGLMGKQNMYEHSVRVPLIIAGPGIPAGIRRDGLSYTMDMYPTLCELAGIQTPASVQSRSLLPLLRENRPVRDWVGCVYKHYQRMITDGRLKLIRYYHDERTGDGVDRLQLFDLINDPGECHDLSGVPRYQAEVTRLSRRLTDWQREIEDPMLPS